MSEVKINKEDIERYYKFLQHERQSELRFIEPRWKNLKDKPIQEWANNLAQFLFLCEKYNGKMNLYVGINERTSKGDSDEDVKFITNIGHDIDAHDGRIESFLKAQEVALKIKDDCIEQEYNEPLIICSGRGFWVIHHTTPIPNTKENYEKIKEFGKKIKEKYEVEGIELDSSVYNASRIARIPGTINVSDKNNQVMSFIVNEPKNEEDSKLADNIVETELPKINYLSTGEQPKSSCAFMDYCLSHEIPPGERHKVISRNMSLYIHKHPDRELLREQYFKIQKGSEKELDQWLKNLDNNPDKEYPFSCGELINFQKKYKIPLKCKGCEKFLKYKKEKKAEDLIKKQIDLEDKEEELNKEGKFLFEAFNDFTNYLGVAEKFIQTQPVYYDKFKIWWLWNLKDKKWEVVDETDLLNAIDKYTNNPSTNSRIKNEILESLKRIGRKNKPEDSKKTWIQFKNNIYDLENDKIFEAEPKYFVTNPIPWNIGKDYDTPNINRILIEWVGEKYVKTLKEIMAYCLLPSMPIHRIFCLIGDGLNGKGTYLRLIEKLVGDDNKCASEIETLASNRFETFKLYKKLVCIIGEIDKGVFKKTKTIKSLTGDDLIRFEKKGKDGFDSHNYAKPVVATNHLPETTDKAKGFYRRWTIIEFPNEFSEKKDILSEIPEIEYNNFCKQSIDLLKELLKNGEFTHDGTIKDRENNYEKHSNRINEFIHLYCEPDNESHIEFADFCEKYNEFLFSEGFHKKSKIEIGRALILKGYEKKVKKVNLDMYETTKMCVCNIKFREEYI